MAATGDLKAYCRDLVVYILNIIYYYLNKYDATICLLSFTSVNLDFGM